MRKKLDFVEDFSTAFRAMIEDNSHAAIILSQINRKFLDNSQEIFDILYDMNMRGQQLSVAFNKHCDHHINTFIDKVKTRDRDMVEAVNAVSKEEGYPHKAVMYGASYLDTLPVFQHLTKL